MNRNRNAFTLIEVLIVVVIMAVLAATVVPQFTDSTADAKNNTALFNLNTLRSQIELYKAQHDGNHPTTLNLLTVATNIDQTTTGSPSLGPYLQAVPENTANGTNAVKVISTSPAVSGDVTADNAGGWLYSSLDGRVWLDHDTLFAE
ncbi:MAG: type II secretion system protein [Planctomycetota bacterium]|nr:MAG: type II secretion system protein [Planctomycetota bacterium]REJ97845.1 MAG: type II secretion system protein [Planctomycetota bacterium]REK18389.1 MAG: type II secretion system protein [Planctomycetota bacterium]REK40466.1 MAG: type II secretion system protein [Planctomycetota bacterium]